MSISSRPTDNTESFRSYKHDANNPVRVRIARTESDIAAAWALVYQAYRNADIIDSNSLGIHTIPHAISPATTVVIGVDQSHQVVSTLTMMHDSDQGLSLDSIYPKQLDELRKKNRQLMEVGLFAEKSAGASKANDTIFEMMRYVFYNSCYSLADIIIGVHPHHARFYKRAFGFEVFGPIKQHPYVRNRPVVLLRGDTKMQISGIPDLLPVLRDYMKNPVPKISFDNRPRLKDDTVGGTSFQELVRPSPSTSENKNHNSSRKED